MISNRRLAFALAFPIALLAGLTAWKQARVMVGTTVVIPIAGFEPRDLLSGHYLTYRLDLSAGGAGADVCQAPPEDAAEEVVRVCVVAERGVMTSARRLPSWETPDAPGPGCDVLLRGRCESGRLVTGVERFYVPEEHAAALDQAVRSRRGAVVLVAHRAGDLAVKDLLIEGKPWRKAIQELPR